MLGSVVFNAIYSNTLDIASGFVFLVMAVFYAVSFVLLLYETQPQFSLCIDCQYVCIVCSVVLANECVRSLEC